MTINWSAISIFTYNIWEREHVIEMKEFPVIYLFEIS